jgi:hypothetical protein
MSLGRVTLEAQALEALIAGDRDLAVELVEQLSPSEAEVVAIACQELASLAADVVADGCRSELGHKGARSGRHLRAVK